MYEKHNLKLTFSQATEPKDELNYL